MAVLLRPDPTRHRLAGHELEAGRRSEWRMLLRRLGRRVQPRQRVRECGCSAAGPLVMAHGDRAGRAGWSGVIACERGHSCPVCAGRIAVGRSDELGQVAREHRASVQGAGIYLLTLTLRHEQWHSLQDSLDALTGAWRRLCQGRTAQAWRRWLGWRGMARGMEIRWSQAHGWHPHLHVCILGRQRRPRRVEWIMRWMAERWQACVERACLALEAEAEDLGVDPGGRFRGLVPDETHGCDLKLGTEAQYIAKLGWEVGGGYEKTGKHGSLGVWDLLRRGAVDGGAWEQRWREYGEAMHGRRMLTWSRGLRPRHEQTDHDLAHTGEGPTVAMLDRESYRVVERAGLAWWLARYLVEDFDGAAQWCAANDLGIPQAVPRVDRSPPRARAPRPLPPPECYPRGDCAGMGRAASAARIRHWGATGDTSGDALAAELRTLRCIMSGGHVRR